MIHNVDTISPCVVVYECKHDCGNLVELIENEASRPWSYIPFITGFADELGTTSEFASLELILGAEREPLKTMNDLYIKCNEILEDCLADYLVNYNTKCSDDSGSFLYKVTGNHFYSTPITGPDNYHVISSMIALTEATIRLDRFDIEFTVAPGDVYILPALFPYELTIQGTPDPTYVAGKHLRGR
jgi:hypothetical protein